MIAAWMLYAALVGGLVAVAARALEELFGFLGLARRVVWLAALVAMVGLTVSAPFRAGAPSPLSAELRPEFIASTGAAGSPSTGPEGAVLSAAAVLREMVAEIRQVAQHPLRAVSSPVGGPLDLALIAVWAAMMLGVLGLGVATLARSRATAWNWPRSELEGVSVRVSPSTGPAVVGLIRPEIVVPRWLVLAPPEARRVAVLHEVEHLRARDPVAVGAGWLCVALAPWSPAVWWMFARLRIAVEVDCDRRVLAQGVRPAIYGNLLIDAAEHRAAPLATAMLAASPSTLERRLRAMSTRLPRFAAARASLAGLVGLLAAAAACDARLPTTEEIEAMDGRAAEALVHRLGLDLDGEAGSMEGATRFYMDGEPVTLEVARSVPDEGMARVEVRRATATNPAAVHIWTEDGPPRRFYAEGGDEVAAPEAPPTPGMPEAPPHPPASPLTGADRADRPLVLVDGIAVEEEAFEALNPDRIERIEVLKGAAATAYDEDPRAANGVIRITTRGGEDPH